MSLLETHPAWQATHIELCPSIFFRFDAENAQASFHILHGSLGVGPSASSIFGGMSTAQTAVLGDSQGSIAPPQRTPKSDDIAPKAIPEDELNAEGGLGGTYVDGGRSRPMDIVAEEDDNIEDGGVLRLLAQIYGRRDGPARAIG